jgi:hypothetical protein
MYEIIHCRCADRVYDVNGKLDDEDSEEEGRHDALRFQSVRVSGSPCVKLSWLVLSGVDTFEVVKVVEVERSRSLGDDVVFFSKVAAS